MHPQAIEEVALFRGDVTPKALALIAPAAPDTDVVADRDGQAIHHIFLRSLALFERRGEQIEEGAPERLGDGVKPSVEPTLAYHCWHVAMLVKGKAASMDVAAEEGRRAQSRRHHFGRREVCLRIIPVSCGLQELLAQAVDGGYGIVHLSSRPEKGFAAFGSGGYRLA